MRNGGFQPVQAVDLGRDRTGKSKTLPRIATDNTDRKTPERYFYRGSARMGADRERRHRPWRPSRNTIPRAIGPSAGTLAVCCYSRRRVAAAPSAPISGLVVPLPACISAASLFGKNRLNRNSFSQHRQHKSSTARLPARFLREPSNTRWNPAC